MHCLQATREAELEARAKEVALAERALREEKQRMLREASEAERKLEADRVVSDAFSLCMHVVLGGSASCAAQT